MWLVWLKIWDIITTWPPRDVGHLRDVRREVMFVKISVRSCQSDRGICLKMNESWGLGLVTSQAEAVSALISQSSSFLKVARRKRVDLNQQPNHFITNIFESTLSV